MIATTRDTTNTTGTNHTPMTTMHHCKTRRVRKRIGTTRSSGSILSTTPPDRMLSGGVGPSVPASFLAAAVAAKALLMVLSVTTTTTTTIATATATATTINAYSYYYVVDAFVILPPRRRRCCRSSYSISSFWSTNKITVTSSSPVLLLSSPSSSNIENNNYKNGTFVGEKNNIGIGIDFDGSGSDSDSETGIIIIGGGGGGSGSGSNINGDVLVSNGSVVEQDGGRVRDDIEKEDEEDEKQREIRRQRRQEFFQINNITVSDLTGTNGVGVRNRQQMQQQQQSSSTRLQASSSLRRSGTTTNMSIRDVLSKIIAENRVKLRQNRFAVLSGLGLAFNSGYINGCCLSGVLGQSGAVAAFTGSYTMAGLAIGGAGGGSAATASTKVLSSACKLIGSFIMGSAVFGIINPTPKPGYLSTRYGPAFLIGSGLMALSAITANLCPHQRTFLYLAAMANGLQNAATSSYSQNLVRTSHMSGITSDMGFYIGSMLRGEFTNVWRFLILVGLSSSFLLGGIVSYPAVMRFKSMALVFNSILYFVIALNIIGFTARQKRTSVWNVATGRRSSTLSSSSSSLATEPRLWQSSNSKILNMILNNRNKDDRSQKQQPEHGLALATKSELRWLISQYARSTTTETGNNWLSESDFASIIRNAGVKNASPARIHDVFEKIDTDHNGFVGADELSTVLLKTDHILKCDGPGPNPDGDDDDPSCTLLDPNDGSNMLL